MATFTKRRNRSGSTSYLAQVRIRPFQPTAQAFASLSEAKAWAKLMEDDLRKQRQQGAAAKNITQLTVKKLIEEFLKDPDTKRLRYFESLSLLLAWWANNYGTEKVLKLNVLKLREARDKLHKDRKPSTVNRYLSAMRSCWNWGRAAGLVPKDNHWPTRLMLRENNERQRYLTDDELKRLMEAAEDHSPTMRAAIVLSIACGLRQSELLRLTWADVDFPKKRVRILRSKNDTPRTIYLPNAAAKALKDLKRTGVIGAKAIFLHESGEPLNRGTLRVRWLEIRDAAKLKDFRWHDLRHSCASFLAQQGASLLEIGSVLGHKSATITRRYAHLVEGAPVTGHAELDGKLRG